MLLELKFELVSAKNILNSKLMIQSHAIRNKTVHHLLKKPNIIAGIFAQKVGARTHQTD